MEKLQSRYQEIIINVDPLNTEAAISILRVGEGNPDMTKILNFKIKFWKKVDTFMI